MPHDQQAASVKRYDCDHETLNMNESLSGDWVAYHEHVAELKRVNKKWIEASMEVDEKHDTELAAAIAERDAAQRECERFRIEALAAKSDAVQLTRDLTRTNESIRKMCEAADAAQRECERLSYALDACDRQRIEVEADLAAANESIRKMGETWDDERAELRAEVERLKKSRDELNQDVEDAAKLIERLCYRLTKAGQNVLADTQARMQAGDWLFRKGLVGSPLRKEPPCDA